jgi:hypothetical protein
MIFCGPININFLLYSSSCAIYSLIIENGGLVTTISASCKISIHSGLLKSPFCFNGVLIISPLVTLPSPSISPKSSNL